jgi:hypothetical protein
MLTPSGPPVRHTSIHEPEHSAPPSFTLHISEETADWHQIGRPGLHKRIDAVATWYWFARVAHRAAAGIATVARLRADRAG